MNEAVVILKHKMMLGAPDQPIVKLEEGQQVDVRDLNWSGPHTLGYRFTGTCAFNGQAYLIEFNENQVEFVSGHPDV